MSKIKTTNTYTLDSLVNIYTKTGLPIFNWYKSRFKTINYLFFEPQEVEFLTNDGKTISKVILKPKSIDGITPVLTRDGKGLYWWEQKYTEKALLVDGNQSSVTSIKVKPYDQYTINDFDIDDKVLIASSADGKDYVARISAIDSATNTITLTDIRTLDDKAASSINVNDGDYIKYLFNAKNPDDVIDNDGSSMKAYKEYQSAFQNIVGTINFTTPELNKTYQITDVEGYVKNKISWFLHEKIRDLAHGIWFGMNVKDEPGRKNETLWVITGIKKIGAELGSSNKFIEDLSGLSDDEKVNKLIDILGEVWESGVYDDGVVTIVGTTAAYNYLKKISQNWYKLGGLNVYTEKQHYIDLDVTKVEDTLAGVSTEWMTDAILNEYARNSKEFGDKFLVILPRKKIGMYQLTNEGVDINGKLMKFGPNLEFEDITNHIAYNKVMKGRTFVVRGHYATLLAGLETGAYRIVKL